MNNNDDFTFAKHAKYEITFENDSATEEVFQKSIKLFWDRT